MSGGGVPVLLADGGVRGTAGGVRGPPEGAWPAVWAGCEGADSVILAGMLS